MGPQGPAVTATSTPNRELPGAAEIDRYLDEVWLERGLSENTLAAYRNDLAGFAAWLARGTDIVATSKNACIAGS